MMYNVEWKNCDEKMFNAWFCRVMITFERREGMQLDSRSRALFNELLKNPGTTSKDLEEQFALTRRQLGYSFNKINDWLQAKNLPPIERTRQGHFIIQQSIHTNYSDEQVDVSIDANILSETQRVHLIIIMILSQQEELSLMHFTSELEVSKNTVLSDLNIARDMVSQYELTIRYSRRDGYLLEGEEFSVRRLLISLTKEVLNMPGGKKRLQRLADIQKSEVVELKKRLEKVEKKLNLKFTDEKIEILPYTLLLAFRRIRNMKVMKEIFSIEYEELSGTKEYQATEDMLLDYEDIPVEERLFITLHLLTTNVHWAEGLNDDAIPYFRKAVTEMLRLFETSAAIYLQDKEELLTKLMLHLKPAYYRVKYQLTEVNDLGYTLIEQEYKELHHLISQSTKPLAKLVGKEIPNNEVAYLTMLIGGWIRRQGESFQEKVKAIVVCPQGISVSRLMFIELRELFPEFAFLDSLSVREFEVYQLDYDIVFSPVFLETKKRLFLANSFLEREEKLRLRRQVMHELHGYTPFEVNVKDILAIVKKHAKIENEQLLERELVNYVNHSERSISEKGSHEALAANLSDFLKPATITLRDSVVSWEEAIRTAAEPLIEGGQIESRYIEAILQQGEKDPYIVISPHLAIPHAAPEDGVNEVSMSLLRLKEGLKFANDYVLHLIVVIAAKDKQQHFRALTQLMELASSEEAKNSLIQSDSIDEIYKVIKKYSKDY